MLHCGHGLSVGAAVGWPRQDLQLGHRRGALAVDGAEAVGAGVAAADDHDVLAGGGDRRLVEVALLHPVGPRQELHRLVDAVELAARHRQVTPRRRPARQHDGVGGRQQDVDVDAVADGGVGAEHRALGRHLVEAAVEVALLHLELGDAVAQQPADAVGALEHDDGVPGARELLGGGQAGRPGPDHGDALAGAHRRHLRRHPALVPRPVDDLHLDLLDRHRVGVDAEHARRLARRRAQPAGELGEVVGGVQAIDGVAPVLAVDEVVPVGDEVAERAAVVAERDAAVHAPPGLVLHLLEVEVLVHLLPVAQAHRHRPPRRQVPLPLQEAGDLTHSASLLELAHSACLAGPGEPPSGRRSTCDSRCSTMAGLHDEPHRLGLVEALDSASLHHREHTLVVERHDLAEVADLDAPRRQQVLGDRRAGELTVPA